jgi:hypothetical protein
LVCRDGAHFLLFFSNSGAIGVHIILINISC